MHSADAPGGSVLPGAQDLSRRAARCAPACRPGSPPADRETQGGGAPMAGCVCANAVVDPTWDAPWIDAMVFGHCPAESGSVAHPREKVAADAVCITRCQTFRADSHAHVAGKDLGRGSFQGNTEQERTLQFLAALHSPISTFPSSSLLLSLSLSLSLS